MDKIQRMSIFLKYAFVIILVLIPVFEILGWIWFEGDPEAFFIPEFMLEVDPEYYGQLTVFQRTLGLIVSTPYNLLGMYCFWQLVKLFTLYSRGLIFTVENSACYRRAAWALLIGEVACPLTQAAVAYITTMNNAVGDRLIMISIEDANLGNIVIACVILAISWVMDEGRKLQDEAELTI